MTVILFSSPSCVWCKKVKDFFRLNDIRFKELDVSKDQKAAQDMMKKTGQQSVPQIWIGGTAVVGFDHLKLEKLLKLHKE